MDNENTTGTQNEGQGISTPESTEKTYTQAEVDILLQKEGDRRVSSAQKKWEKDLAEADKLRSMNEAQRKEYEYEQRIKELENKEREFEITRNKLEASKIMAERGLPVSFVDYMVAEDADDMLANINRFETEFKAAVADAVAVKVASPAPKAGSGKQTGLTQEEFRHMNASQRAEIYRTNPALYRQLANRD